jgi:hypothetical protein
MLHMMGDYTYKGPDRKNGKFPLLITGDKFPFKI